jgi:hypothetical protein
VIGGRTYTSDIDVIKITTDTLCPVQGEYTARYGKRLTRVGLEYWTTDVDPAAAIWGDKDHYIVCDIAEIDGVCPAESSFDAVLLNGAIGHGVDEESVINGRLRRLRISFG